MTRKRRGAAAAVTVTTSTGPAAGVAPVLATAAELRAALQCVRAARQDLREENRRGHPERTAARPLLTAFQQQCQALGWSGRKLRRLARLWEDLALNAFWYGMDEFCSVELDAYETLHRCAGERPHSMRDISRLKDKTAEAQIEWEYQNRDMIKGIQQIADVYHHAVKHPDTPFPDPQPAAEQPLTVKDQADLIWLLRRDARTLTMIDVLQGDRKSAAAARLYTPWITDTLTRLQNPLPTSELEVIAEQWRSRRGRALNPDSTPDFIMVNPLRRQPSTWWWRKTHDDEPPPLL